MYRDLVDQVIALVFVLLAGISVMLFLDQSANSAIVVIAGLSWAPTSALNNRKPMTWQQTWGLPWAQCG